MKDENNISKAIEERREKDMKFESAEQKRHYMLEEIGGKTGMPSGGAYHIKYACHFVL